MKRLPITLGINGRHYDLEIEPRRTLADVIRDDCGLTGTHTGCEHGVCGACTILVDGETVRACLMFAVQAAGHEIVDCGTDSNCSVDYPDYARKVGETILARQADRGILVCGSGVGISVAANKIPGIRAGVCHDIYSAHQGVDTFLALL